jgi:hypothetical protein
MSSPERYCGHSSLLLFTGELSDRFAGITECTEGTEKNRPLRSGEKSRGVFDFQWKAP